MAIAIPTDEALGLQVKPIIAAVALVAVAFYVAGYMLGTAVHWTSANLTRLPAVALATLLFLLPTATIALVLADHGNPNINPAVQESGSHDAEKVLLCHSRSECL
jgi:hypothetical protein